MTKRRTMMLAIVALSVLLAAGELPAQRGRGFGRGRGGRGQGADPRFVQDRDDFHFLLGCHEKIRRTVTNREDGVETLTESDDAEVAARIQQHVASMYGRVEEGRPIHMRDPLFAEVFRHADKIKMKFEKTEKGARVVETSDDPYVVRLIQAHAQVVNLFVKNGFAEVHKNHAVPDR